MGSITQEKKIIARPLPHYIISEQIDRPLLIKDFILSYKLKVKYRIWNYVKQNSTNKPKPAHA